MTWPTLKVSELEESGDLFVQDGNHGEYRPRPDEFVQDGVPFIRAGDMKEGRIVFDGAERINTTAFKRIRKGVAHPGDIILTSKGTVGVVAVAGDEYETFVCSPQTTFWRVKRDAKNLDRRYLHAFLRSPEFRRQMGALMNQTDMAPYLSLTDQRKMLVRVPPIGTQRRLGEIVGALDEKIICNRRMNDILEAMARALFKHWFVDFGTSKTQGFQDSELGPIPNGWRVSRLADLTTKIGSGATPRGGSMVYVPDGVALIRSQNVHDHEFRWDGLVRLNDQSADELRGVTVQCGDVLFNITGDSILRTCVVDPAVLPARVNQHVAIIRAAEGVPNRYLHLYLVQPSMKKYMLGLDAGATRKAVTKGQLEALPMLQPPVSVLTQFREATDDWFKMIEKNRDESRLLARTRDYLLPKLLSGEIEVKESKP